MRAHVFIVTETALKVESTPDLASDDLLGDARFPAEETRSVKSLASLNRCSVGSRFQGPSKNDPRPSGRDPGCLSR
ncbi:MAG: hypothetical protein ACREH5_06440, partial [Candidatus Omnitrophota bacterium]